MFTNYQILLLFLNCDPTLADASRMKHRKNVQTHLFTVTNFQLFFHSSNLFRTWKEERREKRSLSKLAVESNSSKIEWNGHFLFVHHQIGKSSFDYLLIKFVLVSHICYSIKKNTNHVIVHWLDIKINIPFPIQNFGRQNFGSFQFWTLPQYNITFYRSALHCSTFSVNL